jgi:hypothetical protein
VNPAPGAVQQHGQTVAEPVALGHATKEPGHPLAVRASISLDDLVDHPLIEFPPAVTIGAEFTARWIPRATPSGTPVPPVSEPTRHRHFHELVPILERGALGWYTIASFLDTITMPRTMTTVPIRDAPPCTLVPWWHADHESPTIAAFAAVIEETSRTAQFDRDATPSPR